MLLEIGNQLSLCILRSFIISIIMVRIATVRVLLKVCYHELTLGEEGSGLVSCPLYKEVDLLRPLASNNVQLLEAFHNRIHLP